MKLVKNTDFLFNLSFARKCWEYKMSRFHKSFLFVFFIVLLLTSCDKPSESGDQFAKKGYKAYSEGKYEAAIIELEVAIQKGLLKHRAFEVYTCLGNAYCELERYEKSIGAYKKAIEKDPKFHKAWVNLGIAYRLSGQIIETEKCYAKALELQPDYAELHASLGALYIFQEKYSLAIQHLERAIKLDSKLPVAWSNLAYVYALVGKFPEAEDTLKKAVNLGYKNGQVIQDHIDKLKSQPSDAKENTDDSDSD